MPEIGFVKWFSSRKGFGFIRPEGVAEDEEGKDVFVHYTAIVTEEDKFRTLYQQDKVEYELKESDKGQEAHDVKVIVHAPRPRRRTHRAGSKPKGDDSGEGQEADQE